MRILKCVSCVAVCGAVVFSAGATDGVLVREDELAVSAVGVEALSAEQHVDLRSLWPVETLAEIGLPYSAVGWGFDPQPAGAAVRLNLQEGSFVDGRFAPGSKASIDLASGLTSKGVFAWLPSGLEKKVYRVLHETTRNGRVVVDETFSAYFDFADSVMMPAKEFRGAVLGVSQPVECADDPRHPWSRIGGNGDGLRNTADGATLTFAFRGEGSFAAELSIAGGAVTVALDGETVAELPDIAAWTAYAWPVADYGEHTLTLTYAGSSAVSVRKCAMTSGDFSIINDQRTVELPCDLRPVFPVSSLADDALKGLMYSAIGWDRDPVADSSRIVTITAKAGALENGVFISDGSAAITVLPARNGKGTVDWQPTGVSKKIYQLEHAVRVDAGSDATAYLCGYLDFSRCALWASQADVEAAVLGGITHKIAVGQDECWPWQPIDLSRVRSGIATDEYLEPEEETTTTFTFNGCGVLHYDYLLTGGKLEVVVDGATVATFAEMVDWASSRVAFDGYGAHEVVFRYTAVGGGAVAAIRNIWRVEDDSTGLAQDALSDVRADLQEGEVRTPKKFAHVLPFVYSPTNFTGTIDGKLSRVSIVRLECGAGDDPSDVTTWTEVPRMARKLKEARDEGEIKWFPKKGVWKATFEIFDGQTLKDTQIKYFDLRNAKGNGMAIIIT